MGLYKNRELGEIGIFKNIRFRYYIDHAALNGRPCLVLSEINDKIYLLPMSSSGPNEKYKSYSFPISRGQIYKQAWFPHSKTNINISLSDIIEKDLWGYFGVGLVNYDVYYDIISKLLMLDYSEYQDTANNLEKIKDDLMEQQKYLCKKLKRVD